MKNINEIAEQAHDSEVDRGFYDGAGADPDVNTKLLRIHAEVSEAMEARRNGDSNLYLRKGKPEGAIAELADVVILALDLMHFLLIDDAETVDSVIAKKMAYNETRPRMNGGKKF